MHYQCTECDIEGVSFADFEECRANRHQILEFLDSEDHNLELDTIQKEKPSKRPKKNQKTKVKGMIENYFVESIVLNGKPYFLCYDKLTKTILPKDKIEDEETIYVPISMEEYGYQPYSFSDEELVFQLEKRETSLKERLAEI